MRLFPFVGVCITCITYSSARETARSATPLLLLDIKWMILNSVSIQYIDRLISQGSIRGNV